MADAADDLDAWDPDEKALVKRLPERDEKGRLRKGHTGVARAGRPQEIARKARRLLIRTGALDVLGQIIRGEMEGVRPEHRIKAIEVVMDRAYGKAVNVEAHLHLMTPEASEGPLAGLSAKLLTDLARTLLSPNAMQQIPATTNVPPTLAHTDAIEGVIVPDTHDAPASSSSEALGKALDAPSEAPKLTDPQP